MRFSHNLQVMADISLKDSLKQLGLKQIELAQLISVSPRTISQWTSGDVALPGPVTAYMHLLKTLTPIQRATELARVKGRAKMLDDGVYSLTYFGADCEQPCSASGLAVLRSGKILGSDRHGGVFTGSYAYDAARKTNTVHVRLKVPDGGVLVTGFAAGSEGVTLDIAGSFERAAPTSTATVEVEGAPVDVRLTYLGALPH